MSGGPSYVIHGGQKISCSDVTERFYKKVIDTVMENTKHKFSENGISDRVHEKLKLVRSCLVQCKIIYFCCGYFQILLLQLASIPDL